LARNGRLSSVRRRPWMRAMHCSLSQPDELCGGQVVERFPWWTVKEQTRFEVSNQSHPN
jgi:hypothetical protein